MRVRQLAKRIGAELVDGDNPDRELISVGPIDAAGESDITFINDNKYRDALTKSEAGAVITSERIDDIKKPQLIVKDVTDALIKVLNIFAPKLNAPSQGVDSTAKVADNVKIDSEVSIAANVVIEDGVEIGQNSVIGSGCKIGQNTRIGKNCRLDSNIVIYHNCFLGNYVIVQANSTIGSTGFGYSFIDDAHRLIPHNGGVVIEDYVEIGANCCIDRAKFGNTIVGAGTKIDNLVQIAHNVVIGKCCLIAAQVGISGSCRLGDGVIVAGQVGFKDNIEIGNGTIIGAQAGVLSNTPAGSKLVWSPAMEWNEGMRVMALRRRLPQMAQQLKQLIKRVEKLEVAEDHKA